jgi:phosphoglycerate dehydrogenase-like enzyme
MKVLIADKVSKTCAEVLRREGFETEHRPGLSPDQLREAVAGVAGIVVRSDTRVTEEIMAAAPGPAWTTSMSPPRPGAASSS